MLEAGDRPSALTAGSGAQRVAWDQKLTEELARDAWLQANRPEEYRRMRRASVSSPWRWLLAAALIAAIWLANLRWSVAIAWTAYFVLQSLLGRRVRRSREGR
jgi:hypothetical protein